MAKYNHQEIEAKWQKFWEDTGVFSTTDDPEKKKCYILDMFPYPSGDGLHIGHPEGYTATDILARKRRMEGWNVLHPMGWDAFGLPAENYAIKKGIHPAETTWKNIDNFRRQLKMLGFSYDWSREVNTADPAYYRWTQWLFLFFYKKGLAYKKKAPVNWCSSCNTVLANEQVIDGACERCKNQVTQRDLEQWFFRVTKYADRLLEGLDRIDWPEKIKSMQRHWIGRSEGTEIGFSGVTEAGKEFDLAVFTTRPDTIFGVQYVVLAPEHPLTLELVAPDRRAHILEYIAATRKKSELERTGTNIDKSGEPLGVSVRHPFTGALIPLWTADYVLSQYGTGAVMGVPAHDERDYDFAKKYDLPIVQVIAPPPGTSAADGAYTDDGVLVNSGEFSGLTSEDACNKISDSLEAMKKGKKQVNYHLRDWLISRQRYWGPPIPIIYCDHCGEVPVPEEHLPVLLPVDVDFRPTGESPLTRSASFHDVACPRCGEKARRESDTLDTFVDSSWYFLRYPTPHEGEHPFSAHAVKYWCPVDMYVGGAEHAVLHLLYSRFFTKVLFDHGLLSFDEPFTRLRNQGLILGEGGQKMSKSLGNVINPDGVVAEYGADTLRMYEMFMGEFEDAKPWDTKSISGIRRFLDRFWTSVHEFVHAEKSGKSRPAGDHPKDGKVESGSSGELTKGLHKTIKKVSADIEAFKFNTAISSMMILLNQWESGTGDRAFVETFVKLLAPFAPHLTEDLWNLLGHKTSIALASWPLHDDALTVDDEVDLIIQVNGKVRDKIRVAAGLGDEDAKATALGSDKVKLALAGKEIMNIVVVKGRLVNIVING